MNTASMRELIGGTLEIRANGLLDCDVSMSKGLMWLWTDWIESTC